MRLICKLRIHWPRYAGKDVKGHNYYVCRCCDVVMV